MTKLHEIDLSDEHAAVVKMIGQLRDTVQFVPIVEKLFKMEKQFIGCVGREQRAVGEAVRRVGVAARKESRIKRDELLAEKKSAKKAVRVAKLQARQASMKEKLEIMLAS